MESHYLNTTFVTDLDAQIHQHKHVALRFCAELNVLQTVLKDRIERCELSAKLIQQFDENEYTGEKSRQELVGDLLENHLKRKYYEDRQKVCEKELEKVTKELDELRLLRLHVEVKHGVPPASQ